MVKLIGDNGDNLLEGGRASDTIRGKGGDDTLNGNGGDDLLIGGDGIDTMDGGSGNDTFVLFQTFSSVGEVIKGGAGVDTIRFETDTGQILRTYQLEETQISGIERYVFASDEIVRVLIDQQNLSTDLEIEGQGSGDFSLLIQNPEAGGIDLSGWTLTNWEGLISYSGTAGADAFVGSDGRDLYSYVDGLDVVLLGDGDDRLAFSGASPAAGNFDGGDGLNRIEIVGPQIDLSHVALSNFGELRFTQGGLAPVDRAVAFNSGQFGASGVSPSLVVSEVSNIAQAKIDVTMGPDTTFDASGFTFVRDSIGDATAFQVSVHGSVFGDTITGSSETDLIAGGLGSDVIDGGAGNDRITGGRGQDDLEGGAGADRFIYQSIKDSELGARDVIFGFESGVDKIDVRGIDANAGLDGRQHFIEDQTPILLSAGEFRIVESGGNTIISFAVDNVLGADMQIVLSGVTGVTAADLIV